MKGAMADDSATNKRMPNINITTMIGSSQNFFRTLRNSQISLKRDIVPKLSLPYGRASAMKSFRNQNDRSNCSFVCREFSRGIQ